MLDRDGPRTKTDGLAAFNGAPHEEVREQLRSCCAAEEWIARVTTGRPYRDQAALYAASDRATRELCGEGFEQALAGHPRIGERAAPRAGHGRADAFSRQEQAHVGTAGADLLAELAAANEAYERRFGHVYLVCATGRSPEELLALCRSRLGHDPDTERGVVLDELAKINQLRLAKLLGAEGSQ